MYDQNSNSPAYFYDKPKIKSSLNIPFYSWTADKRLQSVSAGHISIYVE